MVELGHRTAASPQPEPTRYFADFSLEGADQLIDTLPCFSCSACLLALPTRAAEDFLTLETVFSVGFLQEFVFLPTEKNVSEMSMGADKPYVRPVSAAEMRLDPLLAASGGGMA